MNKDLHMVSQEVRLNPTPEYDVPLCLFFCLFFTLKTFPPFLLTLLLHLKVVMV